MAGGRPTKYNKKYCQQLIEFAKTGKSYEAFAGFLGVSKQTIYDWEKRHPEFLDAKRQFRALSQQWWEEQGIEGLWDVTEYEDGKPVAKKKINQAIWIFNMKNRFGWTDKDQVEVVQDQPFKFAYSKDDE